MTRRRLAFALCLLLIAAALCAQQPAAKNRGEMPEGNQAPGPGMSFARDVVPFIKANCVECHSGEEASAGIHFDKHLGDGSLAKDRKTWARAVRMLRAGLMPPEDGPKVQRATAERLAAWIDREISTVDCTGPRDPGRVTIRRLNRVEYNNTIRDLLGVDFKPADDFPADDVGYGFDNIGDVLSLPPLLMERYLDAAEKIAETAIVADPKPAGQRFEADRLRGGNQQGGWRGLYSSGEVYRSVEVPQGGSFAVRVRAFAEQAGGEIAQMELRVDDKAVATFDVRAVENKPDVYEKTLDLEAGRRKIAVAFINDYYRPDDPNPGNRDRNLYIGSIEVSAPAGAKADLPETHTRLITATPGKDRSTAACATVILREFCRKAYRRPPTNEEIDRLVKLVLMAEKNGETFERGVQLAVQAVLVSPHFLFRVEADPGPKDPGGVRTISEHELATRLSYFLWSTMPDDELRREADAGRLRKNLRAHVERMIKDDKAQAFVENFAGQWLQLRNLDSFNPNRRQFQRFGSILKAAMRRETFLFFGNVLSENRSIFELIDSDYTFLNDALARHYGMDGVTGPEFRRVELPEGSPRGGVITQASVLAVTSNPTRTSPVKRGRFILEQFLGIEPPPPPPQVEQLKEDGPLTGTLRQRMEQHRRNPNCAVCHKQMDPLGFGLENFDAVGAWRDKEGDEPIDASGELPDGRKFNGPSELKQILLGDKADFRRCLAEKMLTYALGRGLEYYDRCAVDDIVRAVEQDGEGMQALVHAIVASDPFQKRRGKLLGEN
ncbi:MAG: DUF1592 domain-containing protein [Planctomycetia bacterium]|nr:DUF1592 domain-containing protein [Planctomycetia bacterium]